MSHPRRLAATGLVALSLATVLTGCGAGLQSQTYQTRTAADGSNVNLGTLAVRNVSVLPPSGGRTFSAGQDARGVLAVANSGDQPDRLLEASTPAADEVVLTQGGKPGGIDVPAAGSTAQAAGFILRGLTAPLGTGEYVTMTFRFERSGSIEVLVPVAVTGRTQRPAKTGEPGSAEGEPALQGPAGGHSKEESAAGGAEAEAEPSAESGPAGAEAEPSAEAGASEPSAESKPSSEPAH